LLTRARAAHGQPFTKTFELNICCRWRAITPVLIAIFAGAVLAPPVHATVFTDQTAFTNAANADGISLENDNFSSYLPGNITNGQQLGAFVYSFDPAITQPGIASDGMGGQALGDTSLGTDPTTGSGVFVGGEAVTLTYSVAQPLLAFGAVFSYAPDFEPVPGGTYDLLIGNGAAAGTTVGNPDGLDPAGGSFFLGFIGNLGDEFTQSTLFSLANASDGSLVPAYQVNDLVFGTPTNSVPEPSSLGLLAGGLITWTFLWRRFGRITGSSNTENS
jgi:hypothetical protein